MTSAVDATTGRRWDDLAADAARVGDYARAAALWDAAAAAALGAGRRARYEDHARECRRLAARKTDP